LPGRPQASGRLHPVTQTLNDCIEVFADMGFRVQEGPEVEWSKYNFDAVRIPEDHPARDMWDTIWVDSMLDGEREMLLRTHTSPNQVRVMERSEPPVRVLVPGRCYRHEATDATHEWMLTQIEGLAVDEGVRMTDLKGTLYEFARRMFGSDRKIIFHHSYFPFVEPGIEMAIDCFICRGNGTDCSTCHGTGWIEILGAGMVHPDIIDEVGYDSTKHTGFAFGIGIERVAMLRWGIEDIRHFYQNDLRFLSQF
jgi:phenylalanyl-tRNA synthetase alpha chain